MSLHYFKQRFDPRLTRDFMGKNAPKANLELIISFTSITSFFALLQTSASHFDT